MKIAKKEIEQRIENFKALSRTAGVKVTHQRIEIFREVAQTSDHPDVETVFKRVRERIPTVSLDTVYRTLWMLKEMGLVTTLGSHHERTRFDANLHHHHHFICVRCGLTLDFNSEEFNNLPIPDSVTSVGSIELLQVEVRGICKACASRKLKPNKNNNRREIHG